MRLFSRNLVTLLLIAAMAMPAVSPPALRHCHADGDTSHKHRVASVERHGHLHADGSRHSHSSRHSHRAATLAAKHSRDSGATHSAKSPVEHYHVFWFGFQSSLPLPTPGRSDSPQRLASAEQWVPLISEFMLPDAAQAGSNIPTPDLFPPTGLTPRLPVRSVARPLQQTVATWLCDTARRVRSSVLVI